jgi:hypothetical protein
LCIHDAPPKILLLQTVTAKLHAISSKVALVLAQLLGAQHKHLVVTQLVILDDGEGFKGLVQAHAVGDDAAVVSVDLIDRPLDPILLELEELFSDFRFNDLSVFKE